MQGKPRFRRGWQGHETMKFALHSSVRIIDGLRSETIDPAFIGRTGTVTRITPPNENYSCEQFTVTTLDGKQDMFFEEELATP